MGRDQGPQAAEQAAQAAQESEAGQGQEAQAAESAAAVSGSLISMLFGDVIAARAAFARLQRPARHDPERPGGGSWPPGPPPHPRP